MAKTKSTTAIGEKKTTRAKKTATPINGSNGHQTVNLEEVIRVRAYQLYESRGKQDGAHESDWFVAEAEVKSQTA